MKDNIDKTTDTKLKKASEIGVFKEDLWVPELQMKFNKSSIDALNMIENFVDKMKYDNQKVENIFELVDIIIGNGNTKNSYIISLLNLSNLKELDKISLFLNKVFNKIHEDKIVKKTTKQESLIEEPPKVAPLILKQQITTQTFAQDEM